MASVSNEAVAEFFPLIDYFAKRFSRVKTANVEYDDLFQEGSMKVVELLRDGKPVTGEAIKNSARDWVRKEARRGFVDAVPAEA